MYIEMRGNGTYYLRESRRDPETKKPTSKAIYLGKNSLEAYKKLATLTDNKDLLNQLLHVHDCDEILERFIKILRSHIESCDYDNIKKVLWNCVGDLQRFWNIRCDDDGTHKECLKCRHHRNDYCKYFGQQLERVETSHPCRAFQRRGKK